MRDKILVTIEIGGVKYGTQFLEPGEGAARAIWGEVDQLIDDITGAIGPTLHNHYGTEVHRVMQKIEPDMVETTKLTDKKRTFVPAQTIHKYSDGRCFVDDKPITSLNYEAMTMLGAHIQNHAHRYGETCPDETFNLDTPATYGESK